MDAKPLFTKERDDVVAYFCSTCRIVRGTQSDAEQCCTAIICKCGAKVGLRQGNFGLNPKSCPECREKMHLKLQKDKLRSAERISEPTSRYVFSESVSYKDGYFELAQLEEVVDLEGGDDVPFFVYDCDRTKWHGFDAEKLIEAAFESDWFEDADKHVVDFDGLEAFLEEWNAKQTLEQWMWTSKRIIVLDEQKFEDWLNSDEGLL